MSCTEGFWKIPQKMCKAAASIFDPIRNACKRKPSEMSQKVEASDNGRPKWWLDAPVLTFGLNLYRHKLNR